MTFKGNDFKNMYFASKKIILPSLSASLLDQFMVLEMGLVTFSFVQTG